MSYLSVIREKRVISEDCTYHHQGKGPKNNVLLISALKTMLISTFIKIIHSYKLLYDDEI